MESEPVEKTVHLSSEVIPEVLPRGKLGPTHSGSVKLTLWRTSEMTPDEWSIVATWLSFVGGYLAALRN